MSLFRTSNRVRRHVACSNWSSYGDVIIKNIKFIVHCNFSIKGGVTVVSFYFRKLTRS
ncbi:hypothetical protein RchiOBHm_Chr5g0046731 [Rosa chinensis]|uniref:Uncharacterized protein n=1 Tax=Rosa chinensis TaxID=74649 RepID=A0A2P6QE84_ROSCH|nr:hypothetical protein RchiOBHm_Chr5g0046731 [Rosa chinensis]